MSAEHSAELSKHETELRVWMSEWYDHAFSTGFIRPPFILDDATASRLEGYFNVGLTPVEGVNAMFGAVH
ncbi:hypothetical protein [Paraburkholderia fungorum]|jgi:hypothetical protein|uniref:Uncharacterized protein n=1 Tax=Paraburkholderia fungorum TaxID=134537 RepID=A0AAJ3XSS8_9BURK|nr:hypothetical protein [Paraburkholderia fungorum]KFX66959.1 hypothetical protein KBK24_0101780 [Burkholderia sp. K24]AJZ63504.1 hypothetical protein OI25_4816 [Paraburkholderia fungorum]MBB4512240.1 hypothetical protein [Paraburkholderia fungorum]MBB5540144.1 hypothetical protein [Paraburkholderia fungorum]MBB6200146.1 hypothetical protein [Paraburkholderia fungorum]